MHMNNQSYIMKIPLSYCIKSVYFSLLLLFASIGSYASHIVGMDLYYTHVAGTANDYTVTLIAYGDCGPAS